MLTTIPKLIHYMARTKDLTWEESRLVKRAHRMMPDWQFRLWDNQEQLQLVRDHFPQYAARHEAIPFGVARTDVVKYLLMSVFGGFYVDTDYKFFRPLDDFVLAPKAVLASEGADPQKGPRDPTYLGLGSAMLGSQPGYPFWARLIHHIFEHGSPEKLTSSEDIIEVTGPEVMTRFYMAHADQFSDMLILDKNRFFPDLRRMGTWTSATPDTYGAHLYWGSWRNKSLSIAARTQLRRKLNGLLS